MKGLLRIGRKQIKKSKIIYKNKGVNKQSDS